MKRTIFASALIVVVLAACSPTPTATFSPSATLPTIPETPIYLDPTQPIAARVEDLLARMTLDEKIGQMTQPENNSIQPADVKNYYIGSVLSGGGGLGMNSLAEWTAMVKSYQEQALKTRLAIPLIFGIDSVHGVGHINGATIFPHNIGLGATRNADLVRQIGQATAEEMLAFGVPWNFAPVVAVVQDIRWGRTYEGFSEETQLVTELGEAYIQGFQTIPAGYAAAPGQNIFAGATAKHYLGDGGTIWGSSTQYILDQGNVQVDEASLRSLYLPPYKAAVDAGVMSVMASFSSWRGTKMHANKYLLTTVLKGELGFQGFVVSDWGGIDQIDPGNYYNSVVTAINAGVDMNMVPYDYRLFISVMKDAVAKGDISQERIDDAVRRILRAKFLLGLFENPYGDPALAETVGAEAHRQLARQAVRESLVLLKNENNALPIAKDTPLIFLAGRGANDIGMQCGGWTLEWQGVRGNTMAGTSILEGLQMAVSANTRLVYDAAGRFTTEKDASGNPLIADVGIVVVGEGPYAEGVGDKADLSLSAEDVAVINRTRERSRILVVVIVSGRPLVITSQYQSADAWVAAWLPGTEGAGVADVLFGDYPFTGKLPYTWPRSNDQLPLNVNNAGNRQGCDSPLFPFGYGLGEAGSEPIEWIDCP